MTTQLLNILLPVFILAAIGFAWRKSGLPFEREFLSRLVVNIAAPCLVVSTLSNLSIPASEFIDMLGASTALIVAGIAAAAIVLAIARMPHRTFLPVMGVGNTGNLGLPLCVFAFGAEGLALAIAVFVVNSVSQMVFTPVIQSGESPLRTLLTTPVVYATLVGFAIMLGDYELPVWLNSTLDLFGNLLIPLMLLALGNSVAELRMSNIGSSLGWGAVKIVIGFAIAHLIVWLFGLEGVAKGVIILQGSMPSAVFTYLFAAKFNRSPEAVAGIVLSSTLISAVTLPLLVAYVLSF